MSKPEKIDRLDLKGIFEGKGTINEESVKVKGTKVGSWLDNELVVVTWPIDEFIGRVVQIGYNFTKAKLQENKLRKLLPSIIKDDENFTRSVIDIMGDPDPDVTWEDKADMIDSNIDEFIDSHSKELKPFESYRRK